MNEKELYQQKAQAQLAERKAEIAKLKAQAAVIKTDAQIALHKDIEIIEHKLAEAQTKLAELAVASEDAWDSMAKGLESAWESLKVAIHDAVTKLRE